jgi:hypothetical protein
VFVGIRPAPAGNQHDWNCYDGVTVHLGVIRVFDEKKKKDRITYFLGVDGLHDLPASPVRFRYLNGSYTPHINGRPCRMAEASDHNQ